MMMLVRLRYAQCTSYLRPLLLGTIFSSLFAAAPDYEGLSITAIEYEPPQQPLDPDELQQIMLLKPGAPLRMAEVREAINRLYATGCYSDIQVDAERSGGGVLLRFLTKNSWFVGRVAVGGRIKEPPNAGQLVNSTNLDLGVKFSEKDVQQGVVAIQQLLQNNGLYETRVEPRYNYDPATQQVHLQFVIDEGKRARFRTPVVQGDLKVPVEKIVSSTRWRRFLIGGWKQITQQRVQQGVQHVRRMYEKKQRLMASVALDSMEYDIDTTRATPHLNINAGPQVEVRTVGAKLSTKRLQRYVPVYEEHAVDQDLLAEGQRNLRDYFQSQGYFETSVAFKQQNFPQQDKARIDYIIDKGRRHKLVHIDIQGNHYFDSDSIRERMFLTTSSLIQFHYGRYSESYLRRDEEAISNLYRSNGFRDAVVSSRVVDDYKGKIGDIAVFIQIKEGQQWFVSSLEIVGTQQLDKEEISSHLSSSPGQPFSEFNVSVDRDTILSLYFGNGFPDAAFEWSYKPGPSPNQVDLRYVITEGKRKLVRGVVLEGLEATRRRVVEPNILLQRGDPLSPIKMSDTQRRLYDLGVFAKVDMAIQNPDGETEKKYVIYQMEEASKYSVTTGVGAEVARIGGCRSCLEAPAGKAGFSPRVSLDVSRLNFMGLGHTISFRSRVSNLQRRGLLNYDWPRFRNSDKLNLTFTGLYDDSRDVRTFSAKRQEGSLQLSQKLSKPSTVLYRFSYRRVSTTNIIIDPLLVPLLSQSVRVGMLSGNYIQDRRDDPVDAHKGIYNTADAGIASHWFGSQTNFFRFLGRNATYHRIGKKLVLAREIEGGSLFAYRLSRGLKLDPSQAIPLPERFFGGGATSHRGFPEYQAGPRDLTTGFPLGGNALLFHKTELRLPLLGDNVGGVFFHDAGNVYSNLHKVSFRVSQKNLSDFNYMVHAVGFGIRYKTPVGPVRVDLAYGINSPQFNGFKPPPNLPQNFDGLVQCTAARPPTCVTSMQRISHFQFFFSIGQTF